MNWQYWQAQLQLEAHPEGGFYRRIYTAATPCETPRGTRPSMTAIHYLLHGKHQSRWHRLHSDEQWFYHQGCGLRLMSISPSGDLCQHTLTAENPYLCIPAGYWFCAEVLHHNAEDFALVSCTVTPGFDFADFELIESGILAAQYPEHAAEILRIRAAGG